MFELIGAFIRGVGWFSLLWLLIPVSYLFLPNSKYLTKLSDHIIDIVDGLNNWIGEIIKWALPLLVISVAISVFALSIFGISSTKLSESAQYFLSLIHI